MNGLAAPTPMQRGPDAHISGLARPSLDKSSGNDSDWFELPALPGPSRFRDPMHSRVNWSAFNHLARSLSIPAPSLARLKIYDDSHRLTPTPCSIPDRTNNDMESFCGSGQSFTISENQSEREKSREQHR